MKGLPVYAIQSAGVIFADMAIDIDISIIYLFEFLLTFSVVISPFFFLEMHDTNNLDNKALC